MPMAIVIEGEWQKDLPEIDRQIELQNCLRDWYEAGWVPDTDRTVITDASYSIAFIPGGIYSNEKADP